MKKWLKALTFGLATLSAHAALAPGDIAIVGWIDNGKPHDSFSFVTLAPLAGGQTIYFTDNGWTGTQFRGASATDGNGGEGILKFTAVQAIAAGMIIDSASSAPAFTWTTSGTIPGTTASSFGSMVLSQSGDQITAFTGPNDNPLDSPQTLLFTLDDTGTAEPATSSSTGEIPIGLSLSAHTAVFFKQNGSGQDFMAFNPAALSQGTKQDWLSAIGDSANWTFSDSGSLPSGSLSVTQVPEPGPLALLALGVTALLVRRYGRALRQG